MERKKREKNKEKGEMPLILPPGETYKEREVEGGNARHTEKRKGAERQRREERWETGQRGRAVLRTERG